MKKIILLSLIAFSARSFAGCGELLAQAKVDLATAGELEIIEELEIMEELEIIEDLQLADQTVAQFDILMGLEVPGFYAANKEAFNTAQIDAQKLQEAIAKLRSNLDKADKGFTFLDRLNYLGLQFDQATSKEEKAVIIAKMMQFFSIREEINYMKLIQYGSQSKEMKLALYRALSAIFQNDPSWQPPLERAMRDGGVK